MLPLPSARQVLEQMLPHREDRRAVLAQLVRSAQAASLIAPSAWSVTLREDGFRLNVGQVESFGLFGDTLRVLLAASEHDPRLKGLPVRDTSYQSGPAKQCVFVGSAKDFVAAQSRIEELHLAYIEGAAKTSTGKARKGTSFARFHSPELMDYAAAVISDPHPPVVREMLPYPFQIGQSYTRRDVFKLIGVEDHVGGPWFTGYTSFGPDWFIFCGIGTGGRTGHVYENFFDGDRLVWFAKGSARLEHPTTQDLLNAAGRVYVFYREHDRDPFAFAGLGAPVEISDTSPIRVVWALQQVDGRQLPSKLAEEIDEIDAAYWEGDPRSITVNIFERDPNARRKCISHWGLTCHVCSFDFEETYGDLGTGFIHVHHLRPLSEMRRGYELNPIADLRPVCPNCHAMLHRERPAIAIEQLRSVLKRKA